MEDYEKIRELAEKGITISLRLGDRVREAYARINLGSVELLHRGDARAALAHHGTALAIGQGEDNHTLQAYAQFGLAKDHDALDEREEARACLDRAEALFHSLGNVQDGVDVRRFRKERRYDQA